MPTLRKLLISLLLCALPVALLAQPINPISRRIRGFAATPSTCNFSASVVDFGVNTTTNTFYICTSLGWLGMGSGTGTVTTLSVVSANGFAGSVANPTTTPAITLSTTVTGLLKGNGTAVSAAAAGTDYVVPAGNVATASASDHSITSCGANTWASGLSTTWVLNCVQPAFSNISGAFTLAQFPSMAANTTLTNATSGSSVPTAFAMPSCSAAGSALNWTTNTGFGCGSLWASPSFTTRVFLPAGTSTTSGVTFTGDTGIGLYNIAASHIWALHTGTDANLWTWMTPAGTVKLEAANDAAGADVPLVIAGSVITLTPANSVAINGPTAMNNRVTFDGTAQSIAAYTTTGADISVLARSITDTSSSGTVAVNAANAVAAPTLLASSATTYTDSSEWMFTGPPVASTNVTQTRAHTLMVVDATSAASSVTGGFVVATTPGTAATSVGIGGGNVNAGGNGAFGGTLSTTGAYTPSQTAGIVGTTTNNNANAGAFGEYQPGTVAANTTSLSTGTTANVGANTNITLTAGDWDCSGVVNFTFGATTSITNLTGGISTTTGTLPAQDSYFDYETSAMIPTGTAVATWVVPTVRLSNSGSTNVFLVSQATFTASTLKVGGTIRCRRMR